MGQPAALQVAGHQPTLPAVQRAHKRVPRWLRVALRVAVCCGLIALPALAVKNPEFERLFKYKNYSIVFVVLGGFVLPLWLPNLGDVVLALTLVVPLGWAALWIAYGLFLGCSSITFMLLACVVVTFLVMFGAELLGLPVGLFSVFVTVFVAAANSFVTTPAMAKPTAVLLSALLALSAIFSTLVVWWIFPEFNVDEVFRLHHEGLEQLVHLAYHALGLAPPALLRRVASSDASLWGEGSKWRAAFAAAGEQPVGAPLDGVAELPRGASGSRLGGGLSASAARVERSFHRATMAWEAGAKAQVGAKAEVVLIAAGHKRLIMPCCPLLPFARGQLDEPALLALRHVGLAAALTMVKLHSAINPVEDGAAAFVREHVLSTEHWRDVQTAFLAALEEVLQRFPQDFYPSSPPDRRHLVELQAATARLQAAWREQQQQAKGLTAQADSSGGGEAVIHVPPEQASGAAAGARALDAFEAVSLAPPGSAAANALARLSASHLVGLCSELPEALERLYAAAGRAASAVRRCRCC